MADQNNIHVGPPKIVKYDWYQTETHIFINILIKNLKPEDLFVNVEKNLVNVNFTEKSNIENLNIYLCHDIKSEDSSYQILPSKVEIKLKKDYCLRWDYLEKKNGQCNEGILNGNKCNEEISANYPSSAAKKHDWGKIEAEVRKEEKDEKLEGDAAVNKLFQQIYAEGSDEVKKAMNKSFMESGGTVLSTNWAEISKESTPIKPPDGMEWKNWN